MSPRWWEILDASRGQATTAPIDLQAWRDRVDPRDPTSLDRRLTWAGLDEPAARWALASSDDVPSDDSWRQDLVEYLAALAGPTSTDDVIVATCGDAGLTVPFAHALHAPAMAAWTLAMVDVEPQALAGWSRAAVQQLRCAVLARLGFVLERALFDAFRASGRSYGDFTDHLRHDEFASFFADYPVAARLFATSSATAGAAAAELVRRRHRDRAVLGQHFGIAAERPVTSVELGLSDPHHGGRQVAILSFGEERIVYKPKDIRLEAAYHELVRQLSDAGLPFRALTVRARDDGAPYGWVEHLAWSPAESEQELADFYRHAGALMALLYLLGGTDAHRDNLIAHGDRYVLVDAETLFDARLRSGDDPDDHVDPEWSVLRMLIVPAWQWRDAYGTVIDITALGATPAAGRTVRRGAWLDVNTDEMRWATVDAAMPDVTSLPFAQVMPIDADALADGFEEAGRLLMGAEVRGLLRDSVAGMRGLTRRMVFRQTWVYVSLLRNASSGAALRSPQARGLVLEQAARVFVMGRERPPTWPLLEAELRAMEELDVPHFTQELGTESIVVGAQSVSVEDGLAAAIRRIDDCTADLLAAQARLIRLAVATKHRSFRTPPAPRASRSVTVADPDDDVQVIVQRVLDAATDDAGGPSWVVPALLDDLEHFSLRYGSRSLVDGTVGIAAVLATAANRVPDPAVRARCRLVVDDLTRTWLDSADRDAAAVPRRPRLGLAGLGGALRGLGWLRDEGALTDRQARGLGTAWLAPLRAWHVEAADDLDAFWGLAGLVDPLRTWAAFDPHARMLLDAVRRRQAADEAALSIDEARPHVIRGHAGELLSTVDLIVAHPSHDRVGAWRQQAAALADVVAGASLPDDDTLCTGIAGSIVALNEADRAVDPGRWVHSVAEQMRVLQAAQGSVGRDSVALMTGIGGVALTLMCRDDLTRLRRLIG